MPEPMPTPQEAKCACPFCEAPMVREQVIPPADSGFGIVRREFACDSWLERFSADLRGTVPRMGAQNGETSWLCESRQRLFDDVLARCMSCLLSDRFTDINTGLAQTATFFALEEELCMGRARHAVAAR